MAVRFIHLEETESTNRWLHDHAADRGGSDDMMVVTADYQTAGRGQGGNSWESERAQNLLFSILLYPAYIPVAKQFLLSKAHALALKETLDGYTEGISIKWPNDIYWNDRKISGTLIETRVARASIRYAVIGTGINVNQQTFIGNAPNPVSLCQILGRTTDRRDLLQRFMGTWETWLTRLKSGEETCISRRYHESLYRREGWHEYRDRDGRFTARLTGVDDDGILHLCDRSGQQRSYGFKQVSYALTADGDDNRQAITPTI